MHLTGPERQFWTFVADLGDIAVIAPAFLGAAAVLVWHRRYRDVARWGAAFLACVCVTALLKATIGSFRITVFGHGIRAFSFPSGHAGLALVFYGGLSLLIWYGSRSWFGRLAALALLALETLVTLSVFILGWHPVIDVSCGLFLGTLCIAALWPLAAQQSRPRTEIASLLLAVSVFVAAMHGARIDDRELTGMLARSVVAPPG